MVPHHTLESHMARWWIGHSGWEHVKTYSSQNHQNCITSGPERISYLPSFLPPHERQEFCWGKLLTVYLIQKAISLPSQASGDWHVSSLTPDAREKSMGARKFWVSQCKCSPYWMLSFPYSSSFPKLWFPITNWYLFQPVAETHIMKSNGNVHQGCTLSVWWQGELYSSR